MRKGKFLAVKLAAFLSVSPMYFSQAVAAIIPLVLAPLIVQHAGVEVFGVFASLLTVSQVATILTEYSFDAIGPRLLASDRAPPLGCDRNNKAIYLDVLLSKAIISLLALGITIPVSYVIFRRMLTVSEFVGIFSMIFGTAALGGWYLISLKRLWLLASLIILSRLLTIVFLAYMLFKGWGDGETFFLAYALPWAGAGLYVFAKCASNSNAEMSLRRSFQLIRKGAIAFSGNSGSAAQNILGPLIIGGVLGTTNLGIFNAIDRIARTVSAVLKPVFQVLYPRMVRLNNTDSLAARAHLFKYFRLAIIFDVFIIVMAALGGHDFLNMLYGEDVANHSWLLFILICWLSFGILNNILGIQGLLASSRDSEYGVGIWLCLGATLLTMFLSSGAQNYLLWVGVSISFGEFVAFCFYFWCYRR